VSSLHITFNTEDEWREMGQAGWLKRTGLQYHWENDGYSTFDDFLAALKQSKRKSIRQERKSIEKQGLVIERLRGAEIGDAEWTAFYAFYQDTVGAAVPSELIP
jgi:predicted N-acyltransferase